MTLESFFVKLNQNLETAKQTLRHQLSNKVRMLADQVETLSKTEIQGELENLVDDFLSEFTSVYQEFITYIEEEVPLVKPTAKPKKKRQKREKTEAQKNAYVRPTYVHRAFTDEGLRVSKDARPKIMEMLNKQIKEDIEAIKSVIPTFVKGDHVGSKKRITIKPEDLLDETLFQRSDNHGREIESIPLALNGKEYKLLIVLKTN